MYEARVDADSVSPLGVRLASLVISFPRRVLADVVTHRLNEESLESFYYERTATRDLDKSSASSRAIPVERVIEQVLADPYVPERFGRAGPGMKEAGWLGPGPEHDGAVQDWLEARDLAVRQARRLLQRGVHKQDANRLLEPFMWTAQVLTGTEWDNFFALRCPGDADPAFRTAARMMYLALRESMPRPLDYGQWHLPLLSGEEWDAAHADGDKSIGVWRMVSAGRCARISYGARDAASDPKQDHDRGMRCARARPVHSSPFGHQATPMHPAQEAAKPHLRSNLRGWLQHRKLMPHERCDRYEPSEEEIASWGLPG